MEIKNLVTFLQVASLQSFTKAGQALGYSQSNVSIQIRQLEEEVGVKLFDRINRGVVLNQYGERLLPYARQIAATADQMELFLRSDGQMRGVLRVGLVESLNCVCFEELFLRYHDRFPNARMELTVDATEALLEMLQKNLIDAALLIHGPLSRSDWQLCYEREVETVAVLGKDHPLAARQTLHLEDLKEEAFVLMEGNAPYSRDFEAAMYSHTGSRLEPALRLQNPHAALGIVERSRFVSVLPFYSVGEAVEAGRVVARHIEDFPQTQWVQGVLHKDKLITPLLQGFWDVVKEIFAESLPASADMN